MNVVGKINVETVGENMEINKIFEFPSYFKAFLKINKKLLAFVRDLEYNIYTTCEV